MKTIQEYLKTCNRKEVIDEYIFKYAFTHQLINEKYKDITCGEIISRLTKKLNDYIDKLISIEPKFDKNETWILMAIHTSEEENMSDIRYILVKKSDVLANPPLEFITPYGYEFSSFEEILSFYVADNYLTQYEITGLLVDFLFESSWTGFNHENLENTINRLNESTKEIEEHKDDPEYFKSIDEFFKEFEDEYHIEFEKKDPEQEEAWKEYMKHTATYNTICSQIEINKLRNSLIKEEN